MKTEFLSHIISEIENGPLPKGIQAGLIQFYTSYKAILPSLRENEILSSLEKALAIYPTLIADEVISPTRFPHFHTKEQEPFNFFQFGLDMVAPLIEKTIVLGVDTIASIDRVLRKNENVIFFANHQAEIDPQIISLLLYPYSQKIAEEIICVAGHRVTQDPLAIPFSRGRNLICIYSKKYIDHPPEKKSEKLLHNSRAIVEIEDLLSEGGVCIYVAPSGGRDRFSPEGKSVIPANFNPQSIEMFQLLAKKAKKAAHFHLLALHTIDQLPPPKQKNIEIGEERIAQRAPTGISISESIDMVKIEEEVGRTILETSSQLEKPLMNLKQEKRALKASYLDKKLQDMYQELCEKLQDNSYI